jgi:hypothetical protein
MTQDTRYRKGTKSILSCLIRKIGFTGWIRAYLLVTLQNKTNETYKRKITMNFFFQLKTETVPGHVPQVNGLFMDLYFNIRHY